MSLRFAFRTAGAGEIVPPVELLVVVVVCEPDGGCAFAHLGSGTVMAMNAALLIESTGQLLKVRKAKLKVQKQVKSRSGEERSGTWRAWPFRDYY